MRWPRPFGSRDDHDAAYGPQTRARRESVHSATLSPATPKARTACSRGASARWLATPTATGVGPALFVGGVRPNMSIYTNEIFARSWLPPRFRCRTRASNW